MYSITFITVNLLVLPYQKGDGQGVGAPVLGKTIATPA